MKPLTEVLKNIQTQTIEEAADLKAQDYVDGVAKKLEKALSKSSIFDTSGSNFDYADKTVSYKSKNKGSTSRMDASDLVALSKIKEVSYVIGTGRWLIIYLK